VSTFRIAVELTGTESLPVEFATGKEAVPVTGKPSEPVIGKDSIPVYIEKEKEKESPSRTKKLGTETRLPDEYRFFTPELREIGEPFRLKGLDVELAHENFVARADRDQSTYINWRAAFRVALTNSLKWAKKDGTLSAGEATTRTPTVKERIALQQ
jgi:hypothetical protein